MGLQVTLCVDALETQLGGIGRYALELCNGLPKRAEISSVRYYARNRLIDDPQRFLRGESVYPGRGLRRAGRAWVARQALRSSVVHAPNYFLPRKVETGVITVHDLSVFRYPETHPPERVGQFERLFADSLCRASQIITDTETVRHELIDMFAVKPEKVTAVPLAVSERFKPVDQSKLLPHLSKWNLRPGGYGLCISALEPRKKVPELLAAWRRLPIDLRDAFPLVLAGGSGWMNEHLQEELAAAEFEGWLRRLGYVAEVELPHLYAGAALFVYPSIYEGFGLPPIEAMASGVPVIVSNRSCLPEICGDAARYVEPDDDNGFLIAIEESLRNGDWRSVTINRGLERAAGFTWDRCIGATVGVYSRANQG
jgi:glycosyltransferase involved in cell wall biosynthesis